MMLKIKKNFFLDGFIFILVLLWSGSPYQSMFPLIENLQVPVAFFFMLWALTRLRKEWSLSFYSISIVVFVGMVFLTWTVYLFEVPTVYLKEVCFIFIAFAVTKLYDFRGVVRLFLHTMTVIAVVSLVGHVLVNNFHMLQNLPSLTNVNGVKYYVGVLFNYIAISPDRNCGIFWEPGIYASFLTIAIVFETCFQENKPNVFRLLLFFATILTTNSAAGFALWALCIALLGALGVQKNKTVLETLIKYCLILLFVFVAVVVFFNYDWALSSIMNYFYNPYLEKLQLENATNNARYLGMVHNFQLFLEHPIFGTGLVGVATQMKHVADISTSFYLLSKYGILGLFYTVCWIVGVCRQKNINNLVRVLLVCIFLIIVNKETHSVILFSWVLMFFLLKKDICEKGGRGSFGDSTKNEKIN